MTLTFIKYTVDFFNLLWIINLPLIVVIAQDEKEKYTLSFYHVSFISMSSFIHMISYLYFKKTEIVNRQEQNEKSLFLSLVNLVHLMLLLYFLVLVKTYSIIFSLTIIYIVLPIIINFLEMLKTRKSFENW